jgi:hypothetical protein
MNFIIIIVVFDLYVSELLHCGDGETCQLSIRLLNESQKLLMPATMDSTVI